MMKPHRLLPTLLISFLLLSAHAEADFDTGVAAYAAGDYETAFSEFKSGAEASDVMSQQNLAVMYRNGEGVRQDYKEAVKWLTNAAQQGEATAQYTLGSMYYDGEAVLQNIVFAHMWWEIASSNGIEDARENRDVIAKIMTPGQLADAQRLARECVKKEYKNC